ncbi:MAG: sugar phosphate isomerase/epimerase [Alistipes sp.]|nr:sugar phosphate isomerase/epimerase [Alistipes sp.]
MKRLLTFLGALMLLLSCQSKKELGIQLYSVHQDFANVEAMLQKIADAGYTTIETLSWGGDPCLGLSVDEYKSLCNKLGLTITSTHTLIPRNAEDHAATISAWRNHFEVMKALGAKYSVIPGMDFGKTLEEVKATCQYCNEVGELAHEYGLKLGYHNHKGDFAKVEGQTILDYVIQNTDPEKFFIQLDVCPLNMGGADPMHYLKSYPNHIRVLHLKDEGVLGESGKIDIESIFKQFYANGWHDFYAEYELSFGIGENQAENESNLSKMWSGVKACAEYLQNASFVK